jgi:hypothetical protein
MVLCTPVLDVRSIRGIISWDELFSAHERLPATWNVKAAIRDAVFLLVATKTPFNHKYQNKNQLPVVKFVGTCNVHSSLK